METRKLVDASILLIGVTLIVFLLRELQSFVRPLVVAVILSFLFTSLSRKLDTKLKRWSFFGSVLAILAVVIIFLIPTQPAQGDIEVSQLDSLLGAVDRLGISDLPFFNEEELESTINTVIQNLVQGLRLILSELSLIILFAAFIIPSHNQIIENIKDLLGERRGKAFESTLLTIEESIKDYLVVKSVVSLGTALGSLVIMWLFGVKSALLFAALTFLLNFIPTFGSIVAVSIVVLVGFIGMGPSIGLLWLGICLTVIQAFFGSFLEPKLQGEKLGLSPIIILLSLFFWSYVWGIVGILLAIPLTSTIYIVVKRAYSEH